MEAKVRRESQTLTEKIFNQHARRGSVTPDQVGDMIKSMTFEGFFINQQELGNMVGVAERGHKGHIDLEGFNQIAMHFLLKQAKHDSDQFIHKHEIGPKDFGDYGEFDTL